MASSLAGRSIILAGLFSAKVEHPEAELSQRAVRIKAQGAVVVVQVVQRRGISRARKPSGAGRMDAPMDPATYLGRGKVEEIAELRAAKGAKLVVACAKLSPSQLANLERIMGCPVLDEKALGGRLVAGTTRGAS